MINEETPIKREDAMDIPNSQTSTQNQADVKEEIEQNDKTTELFEDTGLNKQNKRDEFSLWVISILSFSLAGSFIHLIVQFSQNLGLDMVDLAIYQLVGGLINCLSFLIILYKKNIWGVWLFFAMMILQIPVNVVMIGYIDESVIDSALIRVALLSIILLIRKDGISAWSILLASNKAESVPPLNDTFKENDELPFIDSVNNNSEKTSTLNLEDENCLSSNSNDLKNAIAFVEPNDKQPEKKRIAKATKTFNKINFQLVKSHKKSIIFLCLLIFLFGIGLFTHSFMNKEYPKYLSFTDKVLYYFDIPNHELSDSLISKANKAKESNLEDLYEMFILQAYQVDKKNAGLCKVIGDYYFNIEEEKNSKSESLLLDISSSKAYDYYEKALAMRESDTNYFNLAKVHYLYDQYDESVKYCQQTLFRNSDYSRCYNLLWVNGYCQNRWDECLKWSKKLISKDSSSARGYYYLSKSLYELGDLSGARKSYMKAIQLDPNDGLRESFTEVAGAPFDVISIDVGNLKGEGEVINNYGSTLYDEKVEYLSPRIKIKPLRLGTFYLLVKLYVHGELSSYSESPEGYTYKKSITINSFDETYLYVGRWGSESKGAFKDGHYRFEFWFGKEKLGVKSFDIYSWSSFEIWHENRIDKY